MPAKDQREVNVKASKILVSFASVPPLLGGMVVLLVVSLWINLPVAHAATCTSQANGLWSAPATWTGCGGVVPQNGDDVIVAAGHTVTVDADTNSLNSLTVGGALTVGTDSTPRTVTVAGNLAIGVGGIVAPGASAARHSLVIGGDMTNGGTFTGAATATRLIDVTFNKNGSATVSGSGSTLFNYIVVNLGTSRDNVLHLQPDNLSAFSTYFVNRESGIVNGTLRIGGSYSAAMRVFGPAAGGVTIPATGGFWLDNPNFTVTGMDGTYRVYGLLRVSAGTLNVGTAAGNSVGYYTGSAITVEGGSLNIAGRLARETSGATTTYTQTGGAVTVVGVGSISGLYAGFDLSNAGSSFTMSGGTIAVRQATSCTNGDYWNLAGTHNVTGGLVQIGDAGTPAAQTIDINSTAPVLNLAVSSTNAPTARLFGNDLTVKGDVGIQSGATLSANGRALWVAGDWTNDGAFSHGNGAVHFNGDTVIGGASISSFFDIFIELSSSATAPGGAMNVAGNWTNNGTFLHNNGAVHFNGNTVIGGASISSFFDIFLEVSCSMTAPGGVMNVAGDWTNDGAFSHNNGAIHFNGDTVIGGASISSFFDIFLEVSSTVDVGPGTLTVAGAVTNNGALKQTLSTGAGTTAFLNISANKYYGVEITPAAAMGDTTVTVRGNQLCASQSVKRCFDIEPASPQAATVRFYYTEGERNGESNANMKVYHWNSGSSQWEEEGGAYTRGGSGDGQYVEVTGVDAYSPFVLADNDPTAVELASFTATPQAWTGRILLAWETISEVDNVGFNLYRAESPTGRPVKLNAVLIPSQGPGSPSGYTYTYLDRAVRSGPTYYYWLEAVDIQGATERFGPVSAALSPQLKGLRGAP